MSSNRYYLNICNFIILLCSIAFTSLGVYCLIVSGSYAGFSNVGSATAIILVGIILFAIACFGIYSAATENLFLMKIHFFLVTLLIIVQVMMGTVALARSVETEGIIYEAWQNAKEHDPTMLKKIEKTFHCCGFSNVHDQPIPNNCVEDPNFGFHDACKPKLRLTVERVLIIIGTTSILLALIESIVLIISLVYYSKVVCETCHRQSFSQNERGLRESEISTYHTPAQTRA